MATRLIDRTPIGITWVIDEPMARACHAIAADGSVWIIDPVDDPEVLAEVAGLGEPAAVVQLLDRHNRDSAAIADRLGVDLIRLPETLDGSPFEVIDVIDSPIWKEKALWWQEEQVLVVAEAVGTNRFYRPGSAGAGIHLGLRLAPPRKALGSYLPQHLLMGHGGPIHGHQATLALQEAMDRSRRDFPAALVGAPAAFLKG
jgi:hypothetical protein